MSIGETIISDSAFVRKLIVLGFDTLYVQGRESKFGLRWQLRDYLSGKGKTDRFKADALKEDVDFDNVINSSFNARALYDELKVKCHPDRFVGDEVKSMVARELILNISKNRNNAKRLLELKSEAREKLNI